MKISALFLLIFISFAAFAQQKDEALASQYYLEGEYAKAADIYERLLKKNPSLTYIYNNYLNCLLAMKAYDEAEKMVRGQVKKFPADYSFKVDVVYVLKEGGSVQKQSKEIENLLEQVDQPDLAHKLALSYTRRNFWDEALQSWLKGRKLSGDPSRFAREISVVYARSGNKQEAVKEVMLELSVNPSSYLQQEEFLSNLLSDSADWAMLHKELIRNSQKYPENEVFIEVLMWKLVQQKEFGSAFIQFKAIDKRKKENGKRVLELAHISLLNGDFNNAVQCFEYVVSLGESLPYYYEAKFGLLEVRYDKIVKFGRYSQQDLLDAETEYKNFLVAFEGSSETDVAKRRLARLYAFYLDKPSLAISMLNDLVNSPWIPPNVKGEIKLELGDYYLMMGEVWDAELIYSQVDKDFKEDALGQEAKFKMARLFYYKGEFERSRAYLEVLKTATTQLIANDAIDLSMLILDNTGLDTTEEPLILYSKAELLIYRNKIADGLLILDQIEKQYPKHGLADEILYARAKAALKANMPDSAARYLEAIVTSFPEDILADNALFELGRLYETRLNDPAKALEYYERLLLKYPGSLFSVEARKNYRRLRGDKTDTNEKKQIMFDRFMN